jgi:hypothetical protein
MAQPSPAKPKASLETVLSRKTVLVPDHGEGPFFVRPPWHVIGKKHPIIALPSHHLA